MDAREAAVERGEDKHESELLCQPLLLLAEVSIDPKCSAELAQRLRAHLERTDDLWVLERLSAD